MSHDEISPHTLRLIRLVISSAPTSEDFLHAATLLSNTASRSSPHVLWDIISRLYSSLTREDIFPDDMDGFGGRRNQKSVNVLLQKKSAAMALERVARLLPIQDQRAFLMSDFESSHDELNVVEDRRLWLTIKDLVEPAEGMTHGSNIHVSGDFMLDHVLRNGRLLVSSSGEEYDFPQSNLYQMENSMLMQLDDSIIQHSGETEQIENLIQTRIKMQRQILASRLGLSRNLTEDGIDQVITDQDLLGSYQDSSAKTENEGKKNTGSRGAKKKRTRIDRNPEHPIDSTKRQSKVTKSGRQRDTKLDMDESSSTPPIQTILRQALISARHTNLHAPIQSIHRAPQTVLATEFLFQIFHPLWHIRYGALLGLRSLLRTWKSSSYRDVETFGKWPQDILVRCIAVLALDRFGDYSGSSLLESDMSTHEGGGVHDYEYNEVVAPVRELAAEVLSILLTWAPVDVQRHTFCVLSKLTKHRDDWEVRHGAMVAFRYIASFWSNHDQRITDSCWNEIPTLAIVGMSDLCDDLKGVSSQVLSCILSNWIAVRDKNATSIKSLVSSCSESVWLALGTSHDVASSTFNILKLYSELLAEDCMLVLGSLAAVVSRSSDGMASLLQTLARFLSHSLPSVRMSCFKALGKIAAPVALICKDMHSDQIDKLLIVFCDILYNLYDSFFSNVGQIEEDSALDTPSVVGVDQYPCDNTPKIFDILRRQCWEILVNSITSFFPVTIGIVNTTRRQILSDFFIHLLMRLTGVRRVEDAVLDQHSMDYQNNKCCHISVDGNYKFRRIDGYVSYGSCSEQYSRCYAASSALAYLFQFPWCNEVTSSILGVALVSFLKSPWFSVSEMSCLIIISLCESVRTISGDILTLRCVLDFWRSTIQLITQDGVPLAFICDARSRVDSPVHSMEKLRLCDKLLYSTLSRVKEANISLVSNEQAASFTTELLQLWSDACIVTECNSPGLDLSSIELTSNNMRLSASFASATVALIDLNMMPMTLTPLIRQLMTSLKNETVTSRRLISCQALINLIKILYTTEKLVTAQCSPYAREKIIDGICCLAHDRSGDQQLSQSSIEGHKSARIIIEKLAGDSFFANNLEILSPITKKLDLISDKDLHHGEKEVDFFQAIVILSIMSPSIPNGSVLSQYVIDRLLPATTLIACSSTEKVYRDAATFTVSQLCKLNPAKAVPIVIPTLLNNLEDLQNELKRKGATILLKDLVDSLGASLAPFVRYLLPLAMSLMLDPVEDIAKCSAASFSGLVRVAPLAAIESNADDSLHSKDIDGIIDHLILGKKLPPQQLPTHIEDALKESNIILRPYQIEGVSWIDFLRTVKLNGALCDDMGLGKTIQALVAVALTHDAYKSTLICNKRGYDKFKPISLVVCPSSLVAFWTQEVARVFSRIFASGCIDFVGSAQNRHNLWNRVISYDVDLVITSYNVLRNDINRLKSITWTFCVLDEGHVLKNPKTATAKACRSLRSQHKLILTGTPVQNRINELWAIFDFLMPNYLGSQIDFTVRFGRDIVKGQAPCASAEDINKGIQKLRHVHQQVLPFILRREKTQVLNELPPKTVSIVPCDLSDCQRQLYQYYSALDDTRKVVNSLDRVLTKRNEDILERTCLDLGESVLASSSSTTALNSLLNLRLTCTHPSLVNPRQTSTEQREFLQLDCSGKFIVLNDLLRNAHIAPEDLMGVDNDTSLLYVDEPASSAVISSNISTDYTVSNEEELEVNSNTGNRSKCLIYAQFRQSLDALEKYLLKPHMPSLNYLRLDGQVEPRYRSSIIDKFNNDDEVKCLLLTTKVGGLGFNLQSASTVIFLENDWNPHADLQAMDRVYRLGQSKAVHVYFLVTSGTVEEKILKIQEMKMKMSDAIVNTDNSTMYSMGTEKLLDLF